MIAKLEKLDFDNTARFLRSPLRRPVFLSFLWGGVWDGTNTGGIGFRCRYQRANLKMLTGIVVGEGFTGDHEVNLNREVWLSCAMIRNCHDATGIDMLLELKSAIQLDLWLVGCKYFRCHACNN